ncbi:MAG: D-inositol 3-phosphate glycosyltransferase [Acidimicrobiia bacterium]|nr:MAG: D-inositol 3-phosphate glycosyltransferase [Acidimicrobiia bacterium]
MTVRRVAFLSLHTSPLLQPGRGTAGGMNVYLDELARAMAARGVEVEVFTRSHRRGLDPVVEADGGYRVHHVVSGPLGSAGPSDCARHVPEFVDGVLARFDGSPPDLLHSHYWLSGWAGLAIKRATSLPLAHSFHTLGRVKNLTRRGDDHPEPLLRIAAELEVVRGADCLVAATPLEAEDLMLHYGADPARICTSPPGVDHTVFRPGDRVQARRRIGVDPSGRLVLYAGRIQPLKAVDVALAAFAEVRRDVADARMLILGGPSGRGGARELARLQAYVTEAGIADRVEFRSPVPHRELVWYYRTADVVIVPSRSESFGLVAAEAQACGVPVIASRVGGLGHVVSDGVTGILVDGWDPADYAVALRKLLTAPELAAEMGRAGVEWSARFSWDAAVDRLLELYRGVLRRAG